MASYLRLIPSHWAGVYACWGLENREAALRMVTGSDGSSAWAANLEIKCFDLTANPYLVLAAVLAAGAAGVEDDAALPEPIDVDPAVAAAARSLDERGIRRLPSSLAEAAERSGRRRSSLRERLGSDLVDALLAVRRSEIERFADSPAEDVSRRAFRWVH